MEETKVLDEEVLKDEVLDDTEEKEELELTEEQAEKLAKEVSQISKYLKAVKTPQEKLKERLEKFELQRAELPEGNYKIAQLDTKIREVKMKLEPNWIWDSANGPYVKPKETEETEQ